MAMIVISMIILVMTHCDSAIAADNDDNNDDVNDDEF